MNPCEVDIATYQSLIDRKSNTINDIGEGFDRPKLDTLFLALPISWKGSLAQYAGRIHRESEGKESVVVYDYIDYSLPMLERMFSKRLKGYEALGYTVIEPELPNQMSQAPLKL